MALSIGLLAGGIVDGKNYDVVDATLTDVWGCEPVCYEVDPGGGGGGGGGGEKRHQLQEVQCSGAQFNCNVQWRYNDTQYSANNVNAQWDVACDTIHKGMTASVVVKKIDPQIAISVQPQGYKKVSVLVIVGAVFLAIVTCAGICVMCIWKLTSTDDDRKFQVA